MYHAVFRETREEPLKRSLSNLVIDFNGSLLLQDRVAEHSQYVVDATDTKTLVVRGSNDICSGQERVRDELWRSYSDSECGAYSK